MIHKYLYANQFDQSGYVELWRSAQVYPSVSVGLLLPGPTTDGGLQFGIPADVWPPLAGVMRLFPPTPDCVDIVKTWTAKPNRWTLRNNFVKWLGEENIQYADVCNMPVRLAESPLEWLRLVSRDVRAVCFVGKDVAEFARRLMFVRRVVCSNPPQAARVYKALRYEPPRTYPTITYQESSV